MPEEKEYDSTSSVTLDKFALIGKIKENRAGHKELFEKAVNAYRSRVEELLERKLEAIRKGQKINHYIRLVVPEDHTADYDRVITMLEMSLRDQVKLAQSEFAKYVMDQWEWTEAFTSTANSYVNNSMDDEGV